MNTNSTTPKGIFTEGCEARESGPTFDEMFHMEQFTPEETLILQVQSLSSELTSLRDRMEKLTHRWKYYQEPVDYDQFDFLLREIQRILKYSV